jgi:hypothetical protein
MTYLWHNRFTSLAFHISKGHFRTFIFVDMELWEIDIGNLVEKHCGQSV